MVDDVDASKPTLNGSTGQLPWPDDFVVECWQSSCELG